MTKDIKVSKVVEMNKMILFGGGGECTIKLLRIENIILLYNYNLIYSVNIQLTSPS